MRATVLVDNNTFTDKYLLGEPGLSILVEQGGVRVLLDCGYSGAFLENARRMGLDLLHLDWVALSHGHLDHTWGLMDLVRAYAEAHINGLPHARPRLLAHPAAFETRFKDGLPEIGSMLGESKASRQFSFEAAQEPKWLTDKLVWLGEVPRRFEFENAGPMGRRRIIDGEVVPDELIDDSALACKTDAGLVVITGCSHSGICNIVEYARELTGVEKVVDVLGGFHLLDAPVERLAATGDYLGEVGLESLHACHCTDLAARIALAASCPVREVGSGLVIEYAS